MGQGRSDRFPRVMNKDGNTLEVLSTLGDATRDADAAAFAAVMRAHPRGRHHSPRHRHPVGKRSGRAGQHADFSPAANAAYNGPVPRQLTDYLQQHKDTLPGDEKDLGRRR